MSTCAHVVLGGTFDHLHDGHKALLKYACALSKKMTIGLTVASMVTEKEFGDSILPYEDRERELVNYLESIRCRDDAEIIPIHSVLGTAARDTSIEAIVATSQTAQGAKSINSARKSHGLQQLPVFLCPLVKDDSGEYLSSTRIRQGIVDREGHLFADLFSRSVHINGQLLAICKKPFGKTLTAPPEHIDGTNSYIVGDEATRAFMRKKLPFHAAVVDSRSRRKPYTYEIAFPYTKKLTEVDNPAGTVTSSAAKLLLSISHAQSHHVYVIRGEEDLLVIPAVLLLPLNSRVYYGDPIHEKIVAVDVTEEKKQYIRDLLLHKVV